MWPNSPKFLSRSKPFKNKNKNRLWRLGGCALRLRTGRGRLLGVQRQYMNTCVGFGEGSRIFLRVLEKTPTFESARVYVLKHRSSFIYRYSLETSRSFLESWRRFHESTLSLGRRRRSRRSTRPLPSARSSAAFRRFMRWGSFKPLLGCFGMVYTSKGRESVSLSLSLSRRKRPAGLGYISIGSSTYTLSSIKSKVSCARKHTP